MAQAYAGRTAESQRRLRTEALARLVRTPSRMVRATVSIMIAASSALGACAGTVVGGGAGGAGPDSLSPAVAMTRARWDQLWDEYWEGDDLGSSTVSAGPDLDPNDLFLRVSDLGTSCGSPNTELTCGGHWQLAVVMPVPYQQVGVYDLDDPLIVNYSGMSETHELNSSTPSDCGHTASGIGSGTIEILSMDATEVRFRLLVVSSWMQSDPSGEYAAARCP
jgi:hypothetical protein